MKFFCIGFLAMVMAANAWAQGDATADMPKAEDTFRVSQVGQPKKPETRDKLLGVFAGFQKAYAVDADGKIVPKNPPSGSQQFSGVVLQKVNPKEYVVANGDGSSNVKVTTVTDRDWKTGDLAVLVVLPAGPVIYADATGGKHAVNSFVEVPGTVPPSKEQFVAALKAGQSFTVDVVEKRDNPASGGLDYIWAKDAAGAETATKIPVPPIVPVDVTYTVQW